jgi:hypothetical protein
MKLTSHNLVPWIKIREDLPPSSNRWRDACAQGQLVSVLRRKGLSQSSNKCDWILYYLMASYCRFTINRLRLKMLCHLTFYFSNENFGSFFPTENSDSKCVVGLLRTQSIQLLLITIRHSYSKYRPLVFASVCTAYKTGKHTNWTVSCFRI